MPTFRLTVDIDADVKKESHTIAIAQGKQLREVVEEAMREYNERYNRFNEGSILLDKNFVKITSII